MKKYLSKTERETICGDYNKDSMFPFKGSSEEQERLEERWHEMPQWMGAGQDLWKRNSRFSLSLEKGLKGTVASSVTADSSCSSRLQSSLTKTCKVCLCTH